MKSLVGYTGFVGSNLLLSGDFDSFYNSKNIHEAFGTSPDLLVYAGVPAQKFLANQFPQKDMAVINNAITNIKKINPKRLVLISTIDIYEKPYNVDENSVISNGQDAYGKNRYELEKWVMSNYDNYLIVRLPGLYGKNIKKNFIYDLIHIIPSMLKEEKFNELCLKNDLIKKYYELQDNNFYKLKEINKDEQKILKDYFNNIGFNALNFTDSRGVFQFYNLSYLWEHISLALDNNIKVLNLSTEPVTISELYNHVTGKKFINEVSNVIPYYNYKSIYANLFNGKDGYIFDKKFVLDDIKKFIQNELGYKLSISNIAWDEIQDQKMYKFLKEIGFDGIEIAPTRIIKENPYEELDEIKKYNYNLKIKYGLIISSMQSIWYGKSENIFNSQEEREELIKYTKKAIDFASTIGCENLVFGCPRNRNLEDNIDKSQAKKIFIDFLKEIGKYTKEKNTVFSIEPNPPIYNTNFINTTEEALNIVKDVNMDSIKVNLDLGTMIENNENIALLIDNIKYINHIHISEPNLTNLEQRQLHQELVKILKDSKYSRFVSIEMKNNKNLDDVKKTVEYVKDVFK